MAPAQIEDLIADRYADPRLLFVVQTRKHAKRKILNREVGPFGVGRVDPAPQAWIVRVVDHSEIARHERRTARPVSQPLVVSGFSRTFRILKPFVVIRSCEAQPLDLFDWLLEGAGAK